MAGKPLVIVESPAKAKTLSRFLGTKYRVEASYGHIRDLIEWSRTIGNDMFGTETARFARRGARPQVDHLRGLQRDIGE